MHLVQARWMGTLVRRAPSSKSRWKRRQALLLSGGAGRVMAWSSRHARRMFAMEAAGRWDLISATISAGRLKRVAAGILKMFGSVCRTRLWGALPCMFSVGLLSSEAWSDLGGGVVEVGDVWVGGMSTELGRRRCTH